MFCVKTIEDLELIYSILREQNPNNQIDITFNWNTKEYIIKVSKQPYKNDPEVPLDLNIEVIYGDSVTGDTPLLLKKNDSDQIYIQTIETIFNENEKIKYDGFKIFDKTIRLEKEYSLTDYKIWSDIGWVDINKVIRHKCNKKIYRVLTHTGCIDVTEDHSLITNNKDAIKPGELKIGDSLLHGFPKQFTETNQTIVKMTNHVVQTKTCNICNNEKDINDFYKNKDETMNKCRDCEYYKYYKNFNLEDYILTEKEAEVWGFFQSNGSCSSNNYKSGSKNSWVLNNSNLKRLNYFKDILESIEPIKFVILDTLKSSGVYKLIPTGSIQYMVDKYRNLFYYQKNCNLDNYTYKIVPNCILNASKEIKIAYLKGYCEDGRKTCGDDIKIDIKGKIGAQCIYYLMRSLGFETSINTNKKDEYSLSISTFERKKENIVKKIIDKGITNNYVYDIETSIGRFGCGVGQLHAFNTDSIFLKFKFNREDFEKNRIDTFNLATIAGEKLTNEVFNRPPIEMEFEKVFQPFVLLTKKRYIGKKFENPKDPFQLKTIDSKGIALTRRDYCKLVKDCYKSIIDVIMSKGNGDTNDTLLHSISVFKSYCNKINEYDVEEDDLCISAMLAKEYSCGVCKKKTEWTGIRCECKNMNSHLVDYCGKCKSSLTCKHVFSLAHVNLAVNLLKRREDVQVNDRIQYIFVEGKDPKQKKGELAEDPTWAKRLGLKFNRLCYLEQLAKPILGLYKVLLQNNQTELDKLIEFVNDRIENYGGKRLKPSDFKIDE